jgi:hypothetical protein
MDNYVIYEAAAGAEAESARLSRDQQRPAAPRRGHRLCPGPQPLSLPAWADSRAGGGDGGRVGPQIGGNSLFVCSTGSCSYVGLTHRGRGIET